MLPKNAKDPEPGHRLLSLTQVTRKAVRIAGGYSGTDIDVGEQAMLKVEGAVKKIVAAGRLAVTDPQSAMKILGYASHHALDYFWSIMPSHIVARAVDTFQDAIELALDQILSPPALDVPDCHWNRYRRANYQPDTEVATWPTNSASLRLPT